MRNKLIFLGITGLAAIAVPSGVGIGAAELGQHFGMTESALVAFTGTMALGAFSAVIAAAKLVADLVFGE